MTATAQSQTATTKVQNNIFREIYYYIATTDKKTGRRNTSFMHRDIVEALHNYDWHKSMAKACNEKVELIQSALSGRYMHELEEAGAYKNQEDFYKPLRHITILSYNE